MDTSPANVSPENVTVPDTAATAAEPPRVPPEAVAVTVAVDAVVLPPASRMRPSHRPWAKSGSGSCALRTATSVHTKRARRSAG